MAQAPEVRLVTEAAQAQYAVEELPKTLIPVTRGIVSQLVDADTLRSAEDVGTWAIRAENLVNGPEGIAGNPLLSLSVERNASNSVIQRVTLPNAATMWTRTALDANTFYGWRRHAMASELDPLTPVVSADAYAPIVNGQTLYVIDPDSAATDFESYPVGFYGYWGSEGSSWKRNDTGLLDGRGVTYAGSLMPFLAWNQYTSVTDIEMLARAAVPAVTTSMNGGIIARAGGGAGTYRGITCVVAIVREVRSLVIGKYVDGTYTRLATAPFPVVDGEPYLMRLRVEGNQVRAKAWLDGESEPGAWMVGVTDEALPASGRMGLFQNSSAANAWDYLAVHVGGGSA